MTNQGTLESATGWRPELRNSALTNTGGAITIDALSTLDLDGGVNGVSITDGTLDNSGLVAAEGTNALHHVGITNESGATFEVTAGTTTLDANGTLTNKGTLEALTGGTLELLNTTVTNTGGAITIDALSTLDLDGGVNGVSITDGTLDNSGLVAAEGTNALHHVGITDRKSVV